jgi:hypothetical protein
VDKNIVQYILKYTYRCVASSFYDRLKRGKRNASERGTERMPALMEDNYRLYWQPVTLLNVISRANVAAKLRIKTEAKYV